MIMKNLSCLELSENELNIHPRKLTTARNILKYSFLKIWRLGVVSLEQELNLILNILAY